MSFANFEDQINEYTNQLSAYKEQFNEYKNQLTDAATEKTDFSKSIIEEGATPIAVELARIGATKVFGAQAGEIAARLTGTALKSATQTGGKNIVSDLAETLKTAAEPAPETEAGATAEGALETAKSAVSSVFSRVTGLGADAEGAVDSAQAGLASAAGGLAQSVASKVASAAPEILQAQVDRLSGLAGEGTVGSLLRRAGSVFKTQDDNAVFGDVELQNFAESGAPKVALPDTNLSMESTYALPEEINLDTVPEAFSGIAEQASNLVQGGLSQAVSFASKLVEPAAAPGLSSNVIARAFMGKVADRVGVEIPDSVVPTQEEALAMISSRVPTMMSSSLLPEGAGSVVESGMQGVEGLASQAQGLVSGLAGQAEGLATGLAGQAEGLATGLAGQAEGLASDLGSTVTGLAEQVGSKVAGGLAEAGVEAGTELAAGAEGGPVGLVIGGLVALGTILGNIFGHEKQQSILAPPMPSLSVPQFVPGLATDQ